MCSTATGKYRRILLQPPGLLTTWQRAYSLHYWRVVCLRMSAVLEPSRGLHSPCFISPCTSPQTSSASQNPVISRGFNAENLCHQSSHFILKKNKKIKNGKIKRATCDLRTTRTEFSFWRVEKNLGVHLSQRYNTKAVNKKGDNIFYLSLLTFAARCCMSSVSLSWRG